MNKKGLTDLFAISRFECIVQQLKNILSRSAHNPSSSQSREWTMDIKILIFQFKIIEKIKILMHSFTTAISVSFNGQKLFVGILQTAAFR